MSPDNTQPPNNDNPVQPTSTFPPTPQTGGLSTSEATESGTPAHGAVTGSMGEPQPVLPPQQSASSQPPTPATQFSAVKRQKPWQPVALVVGLVVLLSGLTAGAYYGVIEPRSPSGLWKRALSNTASAYDNLVTYVDTKTSAKGTTVNGDFKLTGPVIASGTIQGQSYDGTAHETLDISAAGTHYGGEFIALKAPNSQYPDFYFKITGLKNLGQLSQRPPYPQLGAALSSLDGQWIAVDHTFFEQIQGKQNSSNQLTKADTIKLLRSIGSVNRQYLFTTSPDKAALRVAKAVGKEKRGDRTVYHYQVGYNKDHLKQYVTALKDNLEQSKIDAVGAVAFGPSGSFDGLLKAIDRAGGNGTADVYVDTQTKLIRAARFNDQKTKGDYVELAVDYNGGDEIPFAVNINASDGGKAQGSAVAVTFNTKQQSAKLSSNLQFENQQGQKGAFTANVTITPNTTPVSVSQPTGAKSLNDVLTTLLPALLGGFGR